MGKMVTHCFKLDAYPLSLYIISRGYCTLKRVSVICAKYLIMVSLLIRRVWAKGEGETRISLGCRCNIKVQ